MNDLDALLAAVRADRDDSDARRALLDRVQDDDGDLRPETVISVTAVACERCGVPDSDEFMTKDAEGCWWPVSHFNDMNEYEATFLLGTLEPVCRDAQLSFYRAGRWVLVCPTCRRSLVAAKAHATRRARVAEAAGAEPNLFSNVE